MKKFGKIIGYRNKKTVVVRCISGQKPVFRTTLVNEKMRPTGFVMDVFGPVKRPYARVRLKPDLQDTPPNAGSDLFLM